MPDLRDYQAQAIWDVRSAFQAGHRGVFMVAPTGAGKTVIFAEIVRLTVRAGHRVLILVHRAELIRQTSRKLTEAGVPHGVVASGLVNPNPVARVQVAMVWTQARRASLPWGDEPPGLVVVDEAHLSKAATFVDLLAQWPNAWLLFASATPIRLDGQGFEDMVSALVQTPQIPDLIDLGHLVRPILYSIDGVDLEGMRVTRGGEYDAEDVAKRFDRSTLVGSVVDEYQRLAAGRLAAVFASSVEHSRNIVKRFAEAGIRAAHLDGTTPAAERVATIADLAARRIDVLSNYGLLIEGWDCPALDCIVLARKTASLPVYLQAIGRGLRPFGDKADCVVIDHGRNWDRDNGGHGLPDERREWTLKPRPKRASKGAGDQIPITTCPDCRAIFRSDLGVCPRCGWQIPEASRAPARFVEGVQLRQITHAPPPKPKRDPMAPLPKPPDVPAEIWEAVEAERKAKGYKATWSYVRAGILSRAANWRAKGAQLVPPEAKSW